MYGGKKPLPEDGWDHRVDLIDENQQVWIVFSKPQDHSDEWMTYKVVANGRVPKKANYWVVKNIKTGQLAFPADIAMMREHRKVLHQQLEQFLISERV
jgi:hypothetical protein